MATFDELTTGTDNRAGAMVSTNIPFGRIPGDKQNRLERLRSSGRTGWQSSNPFADEIEAAEELRRLLPKETKVNMTTLAAGDHDARRRPKLLVVEDDIQLLDILESALRISGFDVAKVATGKKALQSLEEGVFDLLLSDIDLPDISGLEVTQQLRRDALLQHLPVILTSGGLAKDLAQLAMSSGATDFIAKPFRLDVLLSKIVACLSEGGRAC